MTSASDVLQMIKDNDVKFVDLRLTDTLGKEMHVTVPADCIDEDVFELGQPFDGSSFVGWRGIEASDMLLMPDPDSARMDPFREVNTLILQCNVHEPKTGKDYDRDPRSLGLRAEAYLKSTGIGDTAYFGPEPEFFIFDSVRWEHRMGKSFFEIDSEEGPWATGLKTEGGNLGYHNRIKGGYFPVSPVDSFADMRSEMCTLLEQQGVDVEIHHHEVGGAGQCEIGTRFNTLVKRADWTQILKYTVHNVAAAYGKTATFMPKPIEGDNGSGMHVHQSIWKDGQNLFAGNGYAGLSELALYYIGGVIKHARALNAITNPSINSYRRLVPGFEAPVKLAYSSCNRSASIRIPHVNSPKARRVEVRFPDPTANPYLAFSALLMAGLDGIQNKIHPGEAADKNLYDLPPEENAKIPTVCSSLDQALEYLDRDREFLTRGGVFSNDFIDAYIAVKMEEVNRWRLAVTPIEFDMYYSL
ncbi:MAG: type I glutamate--ammonia ligase [Sutterella wadsworthensis]|jgi:glutamine synthetase type I|nr:type I glutamate--ammonia ligase [Sutterella sp.]MDY5223737.1 type I glutamate--ammonia ligase [Sutterella wadsworthensis]